MASSSASRSPSPGSGEPTGRKAHGDSLGHGPGNIEASVLESVLVREPGRPGVRRYQVTVRVDEDGNEWIESIDEVAN